MTILKRSILAIAWTGAAFSAGYLFALGNATQVVNRTEDEIALQPENSPMASDRMSIARDESSTANGVDKLAVELAQANQEVSRLEAVNDTLARELEQLNMPVPPSITYEQLLDRIDNLPASFIYRHLAYLFDEEYLATVEDPHEFATALLEVALENDEVNNVSGDVLIEFSLSPIYGLRLFSYASDLQQYDRIFAHISVTRDMPNCIIRWKHLATGEILLFKQQALHAGTQSQVISLKPSQGWQTGNYRVSVYDMSDNNLLVGTNDFTVARIQANESESAENAPDMDVIQDLLSSGEAVPKIY